MVYCYQKAHGSPCLGKNDALCEKKKRKKDVVHKGKTRCISSVQVCDKKKEDEKVLE